MKRTLTGWRWEIVDSFAMIAPTLGAVERTKSIMKNNHPKATVQAVKRGVKALRVSVPVTVVVARVKSPVCTCGRHEATRVSGRTFLEKPCAFCVTHKIEAPETTRLPEAK